MSSWSSTNVSIDLFVSPSKRTENERQREERKRQVCATRVCYFVKTPPWNERNFSKITTYIPLRGGNSVVACVVPTSRSESRSFRRGGDTSSCRSARNTNSLGVRDSLRASLITRRLLRSNADRNRSCRMEWNPVERWVYTHGFSQVFARTTRCNL